MSNSKREVVAKRIKNNWFVLVVLVTSSWMWNSASAQVTLCLGEDAVICQGQTVTINDCGGLGQNAGGGQAIGPYNVQTIPYSPDPFNSGTAINLSDDAVSSAQNIGFPFCFFGNTYTQFYIGSNGWISFSAGQTTAFTSATIPSAAANVPKNCIMAPWQDWHPGTGPNVGNYIRYQVYGTAPNRRLVVSWNAVPMFSCTTTYGTFQIKIYETTNVVETHIQNKPNCLAWAQGTATHGLHNQPGTIGVIIPGRNSTQWTTTNEGYRFTPGIQWENTLGQTFPYNNGVLNVNPVPNGTTGYWLSAGCGGQNGNAISDTTWLTTSSITATVSATPDFCSAGVGSATVTNPVGNGPFTYQWMPSGQTTQTANNLVAGSHSVTITDANGCTRNYNVTVPNNTASGTGTSTPVTCAGGSDGTATAEMVPPIGTLTYQWNDPANQTTQTAVGLQQGTYECVITSSSGCVVTVNVTVGVINSVVTTVANQLNATCNSGNDGVVVLSSTGGTAPYSYAWDQSVSTANSATDLYAGTHTITITDANNCVSTISTTIGEPPALQVVNISPVQEICPGSTTTISATGGGGSSPYVYTWFLNGQQVGVGQTISVTPDAYNNEYCVVLSEQCGSPVANACTQVNWPTDIMPTLIADVYEGCFPVEVNFTNISNSGLIESVFVRFGDGMSATVQGLNGFFHIYENPGVYDVEMEITTLDGCVYDTVFTGMIVVHDYPVANFTWSPFLAPMFNPEINFVNMSSPDAVVYNWVFEDGDPAVSGEEDPIVTFPIGEVDDYLVSLIVYNEAGCRDSVSKEVSVVSDVILYAPNSFTPDGDKFNEIWRVYIDGVDIMDFDLFIFNRWGEVMWESHDINAGWNGTYGGKLVPEGTYIWMIKATDGVSDKKYEFSGHINVLR
jgi:gliding motility-associated-like protein